MYEYGSRNFDIGILTADEVENAKSGETGWIFNGYGFGVMEEEKSVMLYYGPNSGGGASGCTIYSGGIRPVINLKTSVQIASGSGTKTDPYRLVGDKASGKSNEKINTRLSGEYVNFDGKKFRIMNIEDNDTTKLLSYDYLRDENSEVIEKPFSNVRTDVYYGSGTTMDTNNWAGYLNDTSANGWYGKISSKYKNMLVKGTYYLGSIGNVGADSIFKDYRFSVCKTVNNDTTIKTCQKTSKTWTGYVGIPRIGEMYASQEPEIADNVDEHLYLYLTTHDSTKLYYSTTSSDLKYVANSPGTKYAARPTITLDSSVYITSGNGTYESPYEISM